MIAHLAPDTRYALHLRAPSVSGGKDWVGSITARGDIHTFWGKTGKVNQHACKRGDHARLRRIIQEKLSKGYREVDEYRERLGWSSLAPDEEGEVTTNPPPARKSRPMESDPPPARLVRDLTNSLAWDF